MRGTMMNEIAGQSLAAANVVLWLRTLLVNQDERHSGTTV